MKTSLFFRWLLAAWLVAGSAGCATRRIAEPVPPADPAVARLAEAARASLSDGAPDRAVVLYREALARAEALDDSSVSAALSFNLAVALFQTGDLPAARTAAAEARMAVARTRGGTAAVALLQARIALAERKPDEASAACDAADAEGPAGLERAELFLIRAEIARARGDTEEADRFEAEARQRMPRNAPPAWRARLHRLVGEREFRAGRPAAAAAEFRLEAEAARASRSAPGVSDARLREAGAWREAGEVSASAESYLAAARSLKAQQRLASAQEAAAVGLALPAEAIPADHLEALKRIASPEAPQP
jgi:hypothetical protein